MAHALHVVDVFAVGPYTGNPLAVVLEAEDLSDETMQAIARETNLSETTFVCASPEPDRHRVRIFTPTRELPFAGHPVLGTAWVLKSVYLPSAAQLGLALAIGDVSVRFERDAGGEHAWLSAPPVELTQSCAAQDIAACLGLVASEISEKAPVRQARAGVEFTLVPVRDLAALEKSRFDPRAFATLAERGFPPFVYLFCAQTYAAQNDLCARMFFDANGVREDPATGSAAACLGAYLLEHELLGAGPLDLRIEQGHAIARPSLLRLRATRRGSVQEISVGGRVIPALQGMLL